ncbi:MAG: hypothetical protein KA369_06795 [Spirochaetes bacterium]|nr:hypothetical protein [Spirochaetota bacterium]
MKSTNKITSAFLAAALLAGILFSGGCDRDNAWDTVDTPRGKVFLMALIFDYLKTFTIGGTVTGLTGTLVLQNNGADDITITSDGTFQFVTPLHRNVTYSVTVFSQPATQTCTPTNGNGTIRNVNITNVTVTCITN